MVYNGMRILNKRSIATASGCLLLLESAYKEGYP